jgi:glycosyltransferase involved in cell wall biosynthesis
VAKHQEWLRQQRASDRANVLAARSRRLSGRRILVFDDRVPHKAIGSGFPRAVEILKQLTELGHFVTLYPMSYPRENWDSVYADIPLTVEVMIDYGPARVAQFLAKRRGYYDTFVVSRHHNMQRLRERLGPLSSWNARVIYDAESVAALRDAERKRASNHLVGDKAQADLVRQEIELARGVDVVLAVSELEKDAFAREVTKDVVVLRHAVAVRPTPRPFADRKSVLFVGAFGMLSPNQDAVLWFVQEVLPRLKTKLDRPVPFVIAGHNMTQPIRALASDTIAILGDAGDLLPLYDEARIFVAPTKYAAGIPLKIIDACAHGVPVVCTSLLLRQLTWSDGVDVLSADSPDEFANRCAALYLEENTWQSLRANALRRIETDYSRQTFRTSLERVIQ